MGMNITLFGVAALLFVVVLSLALGIIALQKWGFPLARTALEAWWSDRWDLINERLRNVEEDVGSLPRVWEEFATDAKKAQERARWHVRRTKKELEKRGLADVELDSLDGEIRERDGAGGNGQGLLELSEAVEEVPAPPPQDPMNAVYRRKWGSG